MDYFKKIIVDLNPNNYIDDNGNPYGRPDVDAVWNKNVNDYRAKSIKHYNGDVEKGTDKFCLQKFLNLYADAINIFNLHGELNGTPSFNRLIAYAWRVYADEISDINQ